MSCFVDQKNWMYRIKISIYSKLGREEEFILEILRERCIFARGFSTVQNTGLQKRSKKLETKRSFFKLKWDLCRISSTVLITRTIYVVPMISRAPNHNTLPLQRFHPYLVGMRFHGLFNDARSARLCSQ